LSYAEGFEDAIEFALHELGKAKTVEALKDQLLVILETVKERKMDRLKIMLCSR